MDWVFHQVNKRARPPSAGIAYDKFSIVIISKRNGLMIENDRKSSIMIDCDFKARTNCRLGFRNLRVASTLPITSYLVGVMR